jgi:hypothetical protein
MKQLKNRYYGKINGDLICKERYSNSHYLTIFINSSYKKNIMSDYLSSFPSKYKFISNKKINAIEFVELSILKEYICCHKILHRFKKLNVSSNFYKNFSDIITPFKKTKVFCFFIELIIDLNIEILGKIVKKLFLLNFKMKIFRRLKNLKIKIFSY